ncbi:MAG: hypothetical protein ORN24_04315 [Burkholderiales bacterium]|nr:hypothetical protein [Burkholderiales bacterium]
MAPFWGGILVGEAPSTLDKPLPPIKLLLSEWALYPSEKTTSDLNPLPDSLGNISCYYNTRLPNVRIIMLGGYQMPYKNISEENNWISDKFASINSTRWYNPNDPTQPQVLTRAFICKNANINGNDCAFNMVVHDSVINNSYKQIDEPQIIH